MVTPAGRRAQVRYAIRRQLSARRACALLGVPRSTLGYRARRGGADGPLLAELRRLAARHPRYGYRRIWALLSELNAGRPSAAGWGRVEDGLGFGPADSC